MWELLDSDGNVVNTIVSGEDFARQYAETNGWTLRLVAVPQEHDQPDEPDPYEVKLKEVGDACTAVIYAGVEVETTQGLERFSLTSYDQIELMSQQAAVAAGAEAVPYHADGELCRMFSALEFLGVAEAATAHIFYHRTYCNHLNAWIRRTEDPGMLQEIHYGAELPEDLDANMKSILGAMGGDGE